MRNLTFWTRSLPLLLAGLLQIMPLWRAAVAERLPGLVPTAWAVVFRLGTGTVAALSSYHAVSGATNSIVTPYTVNATVGTYYSRRLTTSGYSAGGWTASPNPLAPGVSLDNSGYVTGTPSQAGTYSAVISAWEFSNDTGPYVTASFTITVSNNPATAPPQITSAPLSQSVRQGSNAALAVAVSGVSPLVYRWTFAGTNIARATNATLQLTNMQMSDAGTYTVIVTNTYGSVSTNATLAVVVPPYLIAAPTNQSVAPGGTATFTISAGGTTPMGYSWKFAGTNLIGGNTATLHVTNVQTVNTGTYTVVVTTPVWHADQCRGLEPPGAADDHFQPAKQHGHDRRDGQPERRRDRQ